jgi:hypothetical protein
LVAEDFYAINMVYPMHVMMRIVKIEAETGAAFASGL